MHCQRPLTMRHKTSARSNAPSGGFAVPTLLSHTVPLQQNTTQHAGIVTASAPLSVKEHFDPIACSQTRLRSWLRRCLRDFAHGGRVHYRAHRALQITREQEIRCRQHVWIR